MGGHPRRLENPNLVSREAAFFSIGSGLARPPAFPLAVVRLSRVRSDAAGAR